MLWDLTVRNLFTSTVFKESSWTPTEHLWVQLAGDMLPMSLPAQELKAAGVKKVLDPWLLVLSALVLPSRQSTQLEGCLFQVIRTFQGCHLRLMCFWWTYVLGCISHNAPKPFTNKRGWKLFTCKWVTIKLSKVVREATFQYVSIYIF